MSSFQSLPALGSKVNTQQAYSFGHFGILPNVSNIYLLAKTYQFENIFANQLRVGFDELLNKVKTTLALIPSQYKLMAFMYYLHRLKAVTNTTARVINPSKCVVWYTVKTQIKNLHNEVFHQVYIVCEDKN